ncbi:MAG: LAGLIDADG family homing endonuclease [Cyanobacteriota bacterium]
MRNMLSVSKLPLEERLVLYQKAIDMRNEERWGYVRIARELRINSSAVRHWLHEGVKPRYRHDPPNLEPSPALGYVIGVLLGDGCVYKKRRSPHRVLKLRVTSEIFANSFAEALRKLGFHAKRNFVPSKEPKRKNSYEVYAYSLFFYEWWQGFKARFPSSLFRILKNKEHKLAFLRGFYESEGTTRTIERGTKSYRYIRMVNTGLPLVRTVKAILEELGYHPWLYMSRPPASKWKALYALGLSRQVEVQKFIDEVSPVIKGGFMINA